MRDLLDNFIWYIKDVIYGLTRNRRHKRARRLLEELANATGEAAEEQRRAYKVLQDNDIDAFDEELPHA